MGQPLIREFVARVDAASADGVPSLADIQRNEFLEFWSHLVIHTYDEAAGDFRTSFYGTHVAAMYGRDCTGLLISEMGFAEAEKHVRELNTDVLCSGKRRYISNPLYWQDRGHLTAYQVKMPMRRDAAEPVRDVLVCMLIT